MKSSATLTWSLYRPQFFGVTGQKSLKSLRSKTNPNFNSEQSESLISVFVQLFPKASVFREQRRWPPSLSIIFSDMCRQLSGLIFLALSLDIVPLKSAKYMSVFDHTSQRDLQSVRVFRLHSSSQATVTLRYFWHEEVWRAKTCIQEVRRGGNSELLLRRAGFESTCITWAEQLMNGCWAPAKNT